MDILTNPDATQYNLTFETLLPLSVDTSRLRTAIEHVIQARPAMRMRFTKTTTGEIRQFVDETLHIPVLMVEMTESEVDTFRYGTFAKPYDLLGPDPLVRVAIIQTEQQLHLIISWLHVLTDGATFLRNFLQRDLSAAMRGEELEPITYGLLDYVKDEQKVVHSAQYEAARLNMLEHYAGASVTDIKEMAANDYASVSATSVFVSRAEIDVFTKRQDLSPNLFFMAAFSIVLSRFSRERKVLFSCTSHGRYDKRLRNAYGMFVRNLAIQVNMEGDKTIRTLADDLTDEIAFNRTNSACPFMHLYRDLFGTSVAKTVVYNFLGENMSNYTEIDGVKYLAQKVYSHKSDEELMCQIYVHPDTYELRMSSSQLRYTTHFLQMFGTAMKACVENIMARPEAPLSQIPITNSEEQHALLALGRGPRADYDPQETFVSLFVSQAKRTPQAVAVADGEAAYTYRELDHLSDCLAHTLEPLHHAARTSPFVALLLDRTRHFVVSVIGTQKIGCAYLSLDNEYPDERLAYMIEDSGAGILITTHQMYEARIKSSTIELTNLQLVFVDDISLEDNPSPTPINKALPTSPAYLIYTSGSTGQPKGVVVEHRELRNFIRGSINGCHLSDKDVHCGHPSFSFDAHIEDLYPPLTLGASFHIIPSNIQKDIHAVHQFIIDNKITAGTFSTQFGKLLLSFEDLPMRYILLGGERLDGVHHDRVTIINGYGPTECACQVTGHTIQPGERVEVIPIGRPTTNIQLCVTDHYGHLLPRGVTGELCVVGHQVTRGYLNKPELTAAAFATLPIPDLHGREHARCYHTGDLVVWNEAGELEFKGRIDNQVKVRGFRIELAEIEHTLLAYPHVTAAFVTSVSGKYLAAYITAGDLQLQCSDLHQWLKTKLPHYMIPSHWCLLDALPLTVNGKIDTRALPEASPIHHDTDDDAEPEDITMTEADLLYILRDIMRKELGTDHVTIHSNILDIGLTSIDIVKFCLTASAVIPISAADVYTYHTIHDIVSSTRVPAVRWLTPDDDDKPLMIVHAGVVPIYPLSQQLIDSFADEYSVLCYDCVIDKFFDKDPEEWTLDDVTTWMMTSLPDIRPDRTVLMTGFCTASELAIVMANAYVRQFPDRRRPAVVTYDGVFYRDVHFRPDMFRERHVSPLLEKKFLLMVRSAEMLPEMRYEGPVVHFLTTHPVTDPDPEIVDIGTPPMDEAHVAARNEAWSEAYDASTIELVDEQHIRFVLSPTWMRWAREKVREHLNI
ncbi:MAG: amino acid adenylation domain-containing protein [Bacteroidaceae bacterium]|nr:amino acid adenylation domain-containing protein [Bacteroidaceae bacterium]